MLIELAQKTLIGKARARPDLVKRVIGKIKTEGLSQTIEKVFAKLDTPIPLGYSCAGTVIRFTTLPSARFSRVHARCWGSMRCIVEHMQTVGAMNSTILPSGFISSASRLTRLSSVPTSQRVLGAPALIVLMMYSVEPT